MYQASYNNRKHSLVFGNVCITNISCMKYVKHQQMHFNFIDLLLLYCGYQHVSATHVVIWRVISLRTRIQL